MATIFGRKFKSFTMRFEYFSEKIVEQAVADLMQGMDIGHKERLHLLRYLATAAKLNGNKALWHKFLEVIKNYDYLICGNQDKIDKLIIKWIPNLEIPDFSED